MEKKNRKWSFTLKKVRKWCFTLNNWTKKEYEAIKNTEKVKYMIIGKEVGKEGTPHLQGYVRFNNARYLKAIKKLDGWKRCHLDPAKGNGHSNFKYCSKEGDFIEIGERPIKEQGKRNDIEKTREMIRDGKNMCDIVNTINSYQAIRFAEKYIVYNGKERNWMTKVYWIYGPSGSGKTRWVYDNLKLRRPSERLWCNNEGLKWFDGYSGQENVLFDDFRAAQVEFDFLLKLLDRYPLRVPVKGGYVGFIPKRIFITSPYSPRESFKKENEDLTQLIRRLYKIIAMPDIQLITE